MASIYYLVMVLVSGFAIYWQAQKISIEDDLYKLMSIGDYENPNFLTYPFYTSAVLVFGVLIYGIYALLIGGTELVGSGSGFLTLLVKSIVFSIITIVKSYCGPLVLSYVVVTTLYHLMISGSFSGLPLFTITLEWVFLNVSSPVHIIYTSVITIFAFNTTLEILKR